MNPICHICGTEMILDAETECFLWYSCPECYNTADIRKTTGSESQDREDWDCEADDE
jgi:hypothetical protein